MDEVALIHPKGKRRAVRKKHRDSD